MSIPTGYLLAGIDRAIIPDMDKYEIRRLRVLKLIEEDFGGVIAKFADRIDRAPSYVGRMLYPAGKKAKKNISDTLIEVIEDKCDLTPGWLDEIQRDAHLVAVEKLWESLTDEKKTFAVKMIKTLAEEQAKPVESPATEQRRKNPNKGIEARAERYDAENIRRGDYISNEEQLQKRKDNGNPI